MSAKDEVSGGLESAHLVESIDSADHSKSSHKDHSAKESPSVHEEKHAHPADPSAHIHVEEAKKESHESPAHEANPEVSKPQDPKSSSSSSSSELPRLEEVPAAVDVVAVRPEVKEVVQQGINTYLEKAKEIAVHNKYVIGGLTLAGLLTLAAFKKLKKRS